MTRTFLEILGELGHESLLVDRRFSSSVTQVGRFSLRKLASAVLMPGRLIRAVRKFRPDVVVFFATNRTFSFMVDWALSEALRWSRVRRINYLHTLGFEALASRNRVFSWMVARLLGSAHTTVCLGPNLAGDVTRWVDATSIEFISNTVADRPDTLAATDSANSPTVLYLSNLIPEKGAGTFVDMSIELAPEFPDATFVVAGATADEAFTDSLLERVDAAGLVSRIRFPGAIVDPHTKWNLVQEASMLVFPSTYPFETFGLVMAEALSCGTPIAAYRTGVLAPEIESASAGGIVDVGDFEGLKSAVIALLSSEALLTETGHNARALYEREFSRTTFRARWDSVLQKSKVSE